MGSDRLEDYLEKSSEDLPTIPAIASRVIEALDDPEASLDDVRKLIEQDAALTARILKVSNSSVYSFASAIRSLEQGLALLGSRTVRNLIMAVALRETYQNFGTLEQMLWEHSAAAGPVAAALAEKVGSVDKDEAFTAGLLHDIGKAALANSHREEYEEVVERAHREGMRFSDAERDMFGFDHAELGARVAADWRLPTRIISVIQYHHDSDALHHLPADLARLTALVSVATACLSRLGSGRPSEVESIDVSAMPAWTMLGLGADDVEPMLELCRERIAAAKSISG